MALTFALADAACGAPAPPPEHHLADAEPYLPSVRRWAREYQLPESLLLAIIYAESRFDPKARSRENALGLMQLIPEGAGADAWRYISGKRRIPTEAELLDPDTNIRLGAAYLRMLKDHYWRHVKDPLVLRSLVLASYNWGVGNARRRLSSGAAMAPDALNALISRRAPRETAAYLKLVHERARVYEELLLATAPAELAAQ